MATASNELSHGQSERTNEKTKSIGQPFKSSTPIDKSNIQTLKKKTSLFSNFSLQKSSSS